MTVTTFKQISGVLGAAAILGGIVLPTAQAAMQEGAAVTYSGQLLMRIRTGAGGYTAQQRADQVSNRLPAILSLENLSPDDVTVKQSRPYQDASIYVRDRLLITVDRSLARSNGNNDPGALAQTWATRLRGILPGVAVSNQPPAGVEAQPASSGPVSPISDENGDGKPAAKPTTGRGIPFPVLMTIDPRWT